MTVLSIGMKLKAAAASMVCTIAFWWGSMASPVSDNGFQAADTLITESILLHLDKPYYLTGETLWFKAYCLDQQGHLSDLSAVLYLEMFDEHQQPVVQFRTLLESGKGRGQIKINTDWSTGNYTIRAYTAWMRNFSSKSFCQRTVKIFNPLSLLPAALRSNPGDQKMPLAQLQNESNDILKISTDKSMYGLRQPMVLNISVPEDAPKPLDLSISVYPYHPSLETEWKPNSLGLPAGNPTSPDGEESEHLTYYPETVGPIIYGNTNAELLSGDLMLSTGGPTTRIYAPVWLRSNRFAVQLPKESDYQKICWWSTGPVTPEIHLDSMYDMRPVVTNHETLSLDADAIKFLEEQSVNMQVSNLYQGHSKTHGDPVERLALKVPFYGQPDHRYDLDDYTRFPDLHEVFVEYIKYVAPRRRNGSLNLLVWDYYSNAQSLANNIFFDQGALVLLDGLPVKDIEQLMEVDPLRIKLIDVITRKYHVGNQVFHGIVALHSYQQDFDTDEPFFDLRKAPVTERSQIRNFHHPVYTNETSDGRIPDRRNTLYWNPEVAAEDGNIQSISFYTGDTGGTYQVTVTGISQAGKVILQTHTFTVQPNSAP